MPRTGEDKRSRRFGLTAYDAAYLELARRHRLPLAYRDAELRKAAPGAGVKLLDA